ncbi:MAG TPA: tetratricopeptide repeat protein [Usitatibacter sp.]|nr:tetratricopeptide repeat protein [Usitatibacter sp.]
MSAAGPPSAERKALEQAVALFRAGRVADSEALLRRLLAVQPGHADALELLGTALGVQGRHGEALAAFDRAREAKPSSHSIRRNRAQALLHLGRPAEARAELEKALQLRPDHAPSWGLLGSVLAAQGDAAGAERAYRRALQAAPSAEGHYNLALLLQEAGRTEEAIAGYRQALAFNRDFAAAHNNLANALKAMGRAEEALAHYAEALRADPSLADALSNYGAALREAGRFEAAIPLLERAAALKPDSWAALNNLGMAYHERHRDADAVRCYRRALELRPELHEARNNLGNALSALGEEAEAIACYRAVIAQAPAHPDAYSNLGVLLQERGEVDEAIASYRRALELRPDHADALSNLGYLLQEQGRLDEAIAYYSRALEANPRSARAAYNLGLALIVRGELERGWELHEKRFETAPPIAVARRFPIPALRASDLREGHRIAIWREQGVGDQVLYSTLVPELAARGQSFVLEADARLVPAYRRAHPDWTVAPPEQSEAAFASCTRHIAVGTLPMLLRPSVASFAAQPRALLAADAERRDAFRARIAAPGVRTVALSWRSFQPRGRGYVQRKKSAGLEPLLALSRREDLRLVDVQYGDTAAEREAFARLGGRLERFEELDLFNDLDGVLAAIDACDAVVTTSNVTAHLAGALGKETLLVYLGANPPFHYWVPHGSERSLWYPSVRIVTAPGLDSWEKAFARAAELLAG